MLLGRQYRPHFHAYRDGSKPGGESYIDADTLEPLPYDKVLSRITDTFDPVAQKDVDQDIAADMFGLSW